MIIIEYGFVIAGSEIREKKEFFFCILYFVLFGWFSCVQMFLNENVVVVVKRWYRQMIYIYFFPFFNL